ncbi:hypothetical protein LJC41_08330 [Desulfosarcina sp. OttesenSCG-928-G17]|nr:hypothetical protein [Desulfosarcina sp. OttesenSCG-928-G17]
MAKLINLEDYISRVPDSKDDDGFYDGGGICNKCGAMVTQRIEIGNREMTCKCGNDKVLNHISVTPPVYYRCNCGSTLYYVVPDGCRCEKCGIYFVSE